MDEMNELPDNIARAMQELERQAGRAAATVNAARVAEGVLRKLREPAEEIRVAAWRLTLVRVAAAVVVILAGGATVLRLANQAAAARTALPVAASVDSLTASDIASVLSDVNEVGSAGGAALYQPATIYDLTEQELQSLLSQLDATEAT